jgi:hypothetical protein
LQLREGDETALQTYRKHGRIIDAGTIEQAHADAARAWLADTLAGHQSVLIVDTNEQADRLSADLRAELVRLGRVEEHGVPLGRGHDRRRGDLVQARLSGWNLKATRATAAGGPINRRPTASSTCDTAAHRRPILAHAATRTARPSDDAPGSYVADHVALGAPRPPMPRKAHRGHRPPVATARTSRARSCR